MPSHITSSMADATASDEEDQQVEDARSGDMYPLLSQTATAPDHGLRKASARSMPSTEYLNGIRGVAAIMVFQEHVFPWITQMKDEHVHGFGEAGRYYFISLPGLRLFYNGGAAAVSIFFVLSGFVVVQNLLRIPADSCRA